MQNKCRFLLLLFLPLLLLNGCQLLPEAILFSTRNFSLQLPASLLTTDCPEGWDAAYADEKGCALLLQDVDENLEPAEFLGFDPSNAGGWENGILGSFACCGSSVLREGMLTLDYAIGTEGRLLHLYVTAPEKQQRRAERMLRFIMERAEYIGLPMGEGIVGNTAFAIRYNADWAPETDGDDPFCVRLHDSLADTAALGAAAVTIRMLPEEMTAPDVLAQTQVTQTSAFSQLYRLTDVQQIRRFDYNTWAAVLQYDGGDAAADPLCTEHCFLMTGEHVYQFTLIYTASNQAAFLERLSGITLTLS